MLEVDTNSMPFWKTKVKKPRVQAITLGEWEARRALNQQVKSIEQEMLDIIWGYHPWDNTMPWNRDLAWYEVYP